MLKTMLFVMVFSVAAVCGQEKEKSFKVTSDELAKEFKDDAVAAKKKYGTKPLPEIVVAGTASAAIGIGTKDPEIVIETASKTTIRIGVDKLPAKFPAKFTATVTYKDFFSMGAVQELSLKASKATYGK